MSLTFTENGHRYRLDGRPVPNVTTIINGGLPKPALVRWAASTVAEAVADMPSTIDALRAMGREPFVAAVTAIYDNRRNTAAVRGVQIHGWAERVVDGLPVEVPDEYADAVSGYARWLDDFRFTATVTERPCANRLAWYAGRFDVIGHMDGLTWALDVKTGKGVYGDASLQLAAYARAEFYVDADGVEHPIPSVDRIGVLHVQDGGTDLYDMGSIDVGFREFRAAQAIYAGTSRRKRLGETPVQIASTATLTGGALW